jgi:hypothetical protein
MWKDLKNKIDEENKKLAVEPPIDVLKVIHYRVIDTECGTKNLSMGNWFFSFTDIRYVGAYLYQILNLALEDDSYTTEQLKYMASSMISQPADFAGFCGFKTLRKFVMESIQAMEEINDKKDLADLLNSLFLYASHLHTWINHYFPWSYNFAFPILTKEESVNMQESIYNNTNMEVSNG